jgi:hypothetical protein
MTAEKRTLSGLVQLIILACLIPVLSDAQTPLKWRAHDLNRPLPKIIIPPTQYLPVAPPSDAIALFDGKDISQWEGVNVPETKWICKDGYFECVKGSGFIRTKQGFGDVQLHIEWAAPLPAKGQSQGRGNSGVFLMERYEVQVLDSYENVTYADGQAASIYGQYPPLVNAARPPGEWQSYDIVFHRPRFDNVGKLAKPARLTVFHNSVLVQDNVDPWGGTGWQKYAPYEQHADKLPLSLQDHGNPVRFRNVWVRELSEQPEKEPELLPVITLSEDILQKYVGTYRENENSIYKIVYEGGKLLLVKNGNRKFVMLAHSKEKFSAQYTAIDIVFKLNAKGDPVEMEQYFTGDKTVTKKVD